MSPSDQPLILIVEDEPPQAEILRYNLGKEGYQVRLAENGEEGLQLAQEEGPDLIILDWMMPEMSGIEVCRALRSDKTLKNVPIIMLTARGEEPDRIKGLNTGADDYVVKPFSPAELIARVRALLRRSRPAIEDEVLEYEGVVVNLATHKVLRDGQPVKLRATEFKLLCTLMERPGRVFSRERLLDLVWGRDIYVETRTVDVHIRRLRKALNADSAPDLVRTVRGAGYAVDRDK